MRKTENGRIFFSMVRGWADHLRLSMRSQRTVSSYIESLNSLRLYLEPLTGKKAVRILFSDVGEDAVRKFLKSLADGGLSANTRNLRLAAIRGYYSFCASKDAELMQEAIAVSKIKAKTVHPTKNGWLGKEQVATLLAGIPRNRSGIRDRTIVMLMVSTGVRLAELISLRLGDVVIGRGNDYARVMGKGSKQRVVPLTSECAGQLAAYSSIYHKGEMKDSPLFYSEMKGTRFPMSPDNVQRIIRKYASSAKERTATFPDIHPHSLRHTYGALMYRQGLSLPEVAKLMGHEQLSTTEIYAETDIAMIEAAIKKLGDRKLGYDFDKMSEEEQLKLIGLKN